MSKLATNKMTIKNNFHVILSIIIIWAVGLLFIKDKTTVKILGDEFGYWTAAAWITGKDWTDVAALNSYYNFGYGVILSTILRLPLNPLIKYKIAILLNILMLCIVYCIIYYLINELHLFDKKYLASFIALCATLYTGNTFYAQFTMTETSILLGFWLLILLLFNIQKKYHFYKVILFSLLLACLYSFHQRTIGIVIAGFLCLMYVLLHNKYYKDAILFLLITLGLLVGSEHIKDYYQSTYLSEGNAAVLGYNDYSGQTSKIRYLFSPKGIVAFFIGIIGKLFYILSSTYLLAGIAFSTLLKKVYFFIKEKKKNVINIISLFILLSVASTTFISALYIINYKDRFDFLIYGRYNECFLCTLVLIGLLTLFKADKINWLKIGLNSGIYFLLMLVVYKEIPVDAPIDCSFHSAPGIYDTLSLYDRNIGMVGLKSFLFYLLILLFIFLLKTQKKERFIICTCIMLSLCWITSYVSDYNWGFLPWTTTLDQREAALASYIQELNADDKIYFYAAEGRNIDHLQYYIADIPVKCIYDREQLYDLPEDAYFLTELSTFLLKVEDQQDFVQVMQSNRLRLWKVKE